MIEKPVVDLTDQLSSIGGEFLRHFVVAFDQRHNQVAFTRESEGSVTMEPRRSAGLSFARGPVYWRRADRHSRHARTAPLPVQAGDLCIRINGELRGAMDFRPLRRTREVRHEDHSAYTFLTGTKESRCRGAGDRAGAVGECRVAGLIGGKLEQLTTQGRRKEADRLSTAQPSPIFLDQQKRPGPVMWPSCHGYTCCTLRSRRKPPPARLAKNSLMTPSFSAASMLQVL